MPTDLSAITLLVHDYDDAIRFFVDALRFKLLEDTPMAPGKRWVRVAPGDGQGTALLLARAAKPEQTEQVGRQGGGRVAFFLHTDDFASDHAHMLAHGVQFAESPRDENYGRVVVFFDLCGNKWDLIEPRRST